MNFQIRILGETDFDAWDAFVYATPGGSIFSTAEYLDVLCASAGGSFRIAAVVQDNCFQGGIAVYEINSRWGTVVRPRTLLPHNGFFYALGDSKYQSRRESRERKLQMAIADYVEARGYGSVRLKCRAQIQDVRAFLDRGWQVLPTYSYDIDLTALDDQWQRTDRNLKRLIRRCDEAEFTVTDDEDFDSFFDLHHEIHERKGIPLYLPKRKFKAYFTSLHEKGRVRLLHARAADGRSVAAQLLLTGGHAYAHTIAAGSDQEFSRSGVNAFLRWKSFEKLAQLGYSHNDLTDASLNAVSRFKSQFGGELQMSLALVGPSSTTYRIGSKLEVLVRKAKSSVKRLSIK